MKDYAELMKIVSALSADDFRKIVNNDDNFDADTLTEKDKLAIVFYDELAKAIDTKTEKLVLQINDASTRAQTKCVTTFYFRTQSITIQVYSKTRFCSVCTTTRDAYDAKIIEAVEQMTQYKHNMKSKATAFEAVAFEDAVDIIKTIVACVQSINNAKAQQAKAQQQAKADSATEKAIAEYAKKKRAQTKAKK